MVPTHDQERAPGELELVRRLVNTFDAETGAEELTGPAELAGFLEEVGLAESPDVAPEDVARVIEAREALRALLFHNNGVAAGQAETDRLNSAFAGAATEVRFAGAEATVVPRGDAVDGALAKLAMVVRDAMLSGEWGRLKACPDEECQWAFYDRSRNRSRTWCNMQDCGNRAKVRAFRARKQG